jgi:ATP-dependent Clp endopeptidase proteolytic subunit ClpP
MPQRKATTVNSPGRSWFSIKNSDDNETAEIFIYDEIGYFGITAKDFVRALKNISAKNIALRINSPGGEVFDGNAIYNALRRQNATITAYVDGIAASMASVIAMAADVIRMPANSMMMIHNPTSGSYGEADELRKDAEVLDKIKEALISAYQRKTGTDRDEIAQMMDDETWFTAAEALEAGFADYVDDAVEVKNSFDLSRFERVPANVARIDTPTASMPKETPEAQIKRLEDAASTFETEKKGLITRAETAEAKVTKLEGEVKTANDKVTKAEGELKTANEKISKVEGELKTANEKISKLEGENKSADEKAREQAAAMGVQPSGKSQESAKSAAEDGKALWDQYNKLMTDGDSLKATNFWNEHQKALEAYAASTRKD